MNEAHVFQHKYTGIQIFVYHCKSQYGARLKFLNIVTDETDWVYLGIKTKKKKVSSNPICRK